MTAILLGALAARVPRRHWSWPRPAGWPPARSRWPSSTLTVSRLPDPLTAAAYAGTAVLLLLAAAAGGPGASWAALLRAALGGLALAGFYLLLLIISPSGMSLGDVKLAASLGTLLAWFGWRVLIAGGAAGFLLGGLAGVVLLVSRRAARKQLIPFGPYHDRRRGPGRARLAPPGCLADVDGLAGDPYQLVEEGGDVHRDPDAAVRDGRQRHVGVAVDGERGADEERPGCTSRRAARAPSRA